MRTKRSREAYLEIDHRESPGLTREIMRANGLTGPVVGKGEHFKSAMVVCCGCQRDVILNPNRSRDREWCYACDSYMCDDCALVKKLTGVHTPAKLKFERSVRRTS